MKTLAAFFILALSLWCFRNTGKVARAFSASTAQAADKQAVKELDEGTLDGLFIESIVIHGLLQTVPQVVRNELLFAVGEPFSKGNLRASLQRLRNMRIFTGVSGLATRSPDNKVDIAITVSEKWTLIPVVRGGVGGGTAFYVLGLYDLNTFGRYIDVGAQYESYGGASSGVAWFRDPQFLQTRTRAIFEGGYLNRQRMLYTQDGNLQGAYLLTRRRAFALFDHEFPQGFVAGLGAELLGDTASSRTLSPSQNLTNVESNFQRPKNTFVALLRGHLQFGGLNYDEFLVEGKLVDFTLEGASARVGSDVSFMRGVVALSVFDRFAQIHNFGFRLSAGLSNATQLQHKFYIGGLEHIRGFYDGQFVGDRFWFSNVEYRAPSLVLQQVILHHVVFFDAGGANAKWKLLAPGSSSLGASAGTGVRFIVPFIARFNVRVDYAWAFSPRFQQGVVAGMQQFF